MAELKYHLVPHQHKKFLEKASAKKGFDDAVEALALEYQLAKGMLKARAKVGLTQGGVAEKMGTIKSAVSRLEAAGNHAPSLTTLKRYASVVGCELLVRFVRQKTS